MRICAADVKPYALPFARPLLTARGRVAERRGWVVRLKDNLGRSGFGDAAPWPGFGSSGSGVSESLMRLSAGGGPLIGLDVGTTQDVADWLAENPLPPEVAYAVELALLDLLGKQLRAPIAALLAPETSNEVRTHTLLTNSRLIGADCVKLKIGSGPIHEDLRQVEQLRRRLDPSTRLRLDVGAGWDRDRAARALEKLEAHDIEWVEQPLHPDDIAGTAELRRRTWLPIALDESINSPERLEEVIAAGAADVAVIKPMFVGGLLMAQRLVERANEAGLSAILTNALESVVGRSGVLHLAASCPGTHGLTSILGRDLCEGSAVREGVISVPAAPGLGVEPSTSDPTAVPNPIHSTSLARPEHVVLETETHTYSASQLRDAVARRAGSLAAAGVTENSVVALRRRPDADWIVDWHAIGWLGAAVAPLPFDSAPKLAQEELSTLQPDLVLDGSEELPDAPPVPERFWPIGETRALVLTSGTTGSPKMVPLTTAQLLFSAFGSAVRLGHQRDDRWLCCLPLHRVGGLSIVSRCALYGTTVVARERFDAREVDGLIAAGEVTIISLVPTMLKDLLDVHGEQPFSPVLRAVLLGGSAASAELLQRCEALGLPVATTWGMTETGSQVATSAPGEADQGMFPLPFSRVDVVDGRLRIRGPLAGPDFLSADCGTVDAAGQVIITGRADAALNSGGLQVVPERVEAALTQHPAVAECLVLGVADARWGTRPVALVVGERVDDETLRDWCGEHLGRAERPDRFQWVTSLPRNDMGKLCREAARSLLEAEPTEGQLDARVYREERPEQQLGGRCGS